MRRPWRRERRASAAVRGLPAGLLLTVILAACGSAAVVSTPAPSVASPTTGPAPSLATTSVAPSAPPTTNLAAGDACAHVVAVEVSGDPAGYTFSVTVSSTETGWDKYADLWTVAGLDGTVYGERVLAHPHVEEQPFTRSLSGVVVPSGTTDVVVAARDSVLGFCGDTLTVPIDGAG